MGEEITIVRMIEKLTDDGYDVEVNPQDSSLRITAITGRFQVSRFVPANYRPSELAFIFWDISTHIKRLERRYGRGMD